MRERLPRGSPRLQGGARAYPPKPSGEWAARGDDGRTYPWGYDAPDATRAVWGEPLSLRGAQVVSETVLAGPGRFGAEDQAGNVWEWCLDAWGEQQWSDDRRPLSS